jgi:phosphoribosylamine--glycine ligase
VIKADGLAAGKGVVVAPDAAQAREAVRSLMRGGAVGQAGRRVVIEELLEGEEVSAIAVCDGERYLMFPSAQDHKRLLDGDQGPNTGGMGAVSPARALGAGGLEEVGRSIIAPVLARMASRGTPFVGALYAGLMLTAKGPRVLEFNCRFGDPETQVQLLRFRGDLAALLAAAAAGDLRGRSANFSDKACVGVVLAAAGYPSNPVAGAIIEGLEELPTGDELQVFHAGTRLDASGRLTASGGRVLTVCALGDGLTQARERAYQAADAIRFEGRQLRRDIGLRAIA